MDYSPLILKKTRTSMAYMNGYRVLRYEFKGLFYLITAVLLVVMWDSFFHDNLFRIDVWIYLTMAALLLPFLYCYFRPIRLMAVVKFLDNQLKLQQRLETFLENLGKEDEVVNLQRKDTFRLLSAFDPVSVVKFNWPLEARIIPFILFFICLLFAGRGLFDSERRFLTELNHTNEEDINYQIVTNPFKKGTLIPSNNKKDSHLKKNRNNTKKVFKTGVGDSVGLTKFKIPKNDKIQSKLNSTNYKAMKGHNQQEGDDLIRSANTSKVEKNRSSHKDKKILINPVGEADTDITRRRKKNELTTMSKLNASTLTESVVSNTEIVINEKVGEGAPSPVKNNNSTIRGSGSAGSGSLSNSKEEYKSSRLIQHSFVRNLNQIEEMISKNNVQPSLREYVKQYFLSLSAKSAVSE